MTDHRQVQVLIALPGKPGTKIDWLDILCGEGAAVVRSDILAAVAIEPSREDIDIERIRAAYPPLPGLDYRLTEEGEVWAHKCTTKTNKKTGEVEQIWVQVSTPIAAPSFLRKLDAEQHYGLRVVLEDMNGKSRSVDIHRDELPQRAASEIRGRLMAAGLRVANGGELDVVAALKRVKPSREIIAVSRTGRHVWPEGDVFLVTPGGRTFGDVKAKQKIELIGRLLRAEAGTLEEWQTAVSIAGTIERCPHWRLAPAAGFAGAVIDLCRLESHGMHSSGPSSLGKTTTLRLAVSVWTSPIFGEGLLNSMLSTENAVEVLARQSHGTSLALDEAGNVPGKLLGHVIYMLAGGTGKSRMNADGSLRATSTWSTFVLSSGEKPLAQKITEDGGQFSQGMAVRFFNLDVSGVNAQVDRATLDRINTINEHYGLAGPAFLEGVVKRGWHKNPEPLRQRILAKARELAGAGVDSAYLRAAMPLAIIAVAGEVAIEMGILPKVDLTDAVEWAWTQFLLSREAEALNPQALALGNLRRWIAEHWNTSIRDVDAADGTRVLTRDAHGWYDADAIYLPTSRVDEATGGVVSPKAFAQMLDRYALLERRSDTQRAAIRKIPVIGRIDAYALKREAFRDAEAAAKARAAERAHDDDELSRMRHAFGEDER